MVYYVQEFVINMYKAQRDDRERKEAIVVTSLDQKVEV